MTVMFLPGSDSEDLLLFSGEDLVDLLHIFVMQFLHLVLGILLSVFAKTLLDLLLQSLYCLAACVADGYLGGFRLCLALLHELFAAVFGEGWD